MAFTTRSEVLNFLPSAKTVTAEKKSHAPPVHKLSRNENIQLNFASQPYDCISMTAYLQAHPNGVVDGTFAMKEVVKNRSTSSEYKFTMKGPVKITATTAKPDSTGVSNAKIEIVPENVSDFDKTLGLTIAPLKQTVQVNTTFGTDSAGNLGTHWNSNFPGAFRGTLFAQNQRVATSSVILGTLANGRTAAECVFDDTVLNSSEHLLTCPAE